MLRLGSKIINNCAPVLPEVISNYHYFVESYPIPNQIGGTYKT